MHRVRYMPFRKHAENTHKNPTDHKDSGRSHGLPCLAACLDFPLGLSCKPKGQSASLFKFFYKAT